jgi:hypothetical protein
MEVCFGAEKRESDVEMVWQKLLYLSSADVSCQLSQLYRDHSARE